MGGIGAPGCGLSRWWDSGISPDRDRWQAGGSWALPLAGETEKSLDQDWGAGGGQVARGPALGSWAHLGIPQDDLHGFNSGLQFSVGVEQTREKERRAE